jgi:ADP-ribose pyrophosphatase YjhB (NUDIX family)
MRPVCSSCGYTHYPNPPLAVGVLATDESGRVVLIRRGEAPRVGFWALPAGFMESDESVENAALRECYEETGLHVALDGLWGVWSYRHADRETSGVLVIYRAHVTGGEPRAGSDTTDVRLVDASQIPFAELAFETHREALLRWVGERFPDLKEAEQPQGQDTDSA